VLDVGSGLGVDAFIAANYAGEKGKVVGIDIAKREVEHAQKRATDRNLDIRFINADMEAIPVPDGSFDVVISNGAFCMAPNKEKAFAEIFRVLKPGGRISICTSTVTANLEAGVNWPLCMRMFIHKDEIEPLCKKLGFADVAIDDSNSLMQYELPEDWVEEQKNENEKDDKAQERFKVHVGSDEFKHLADYNMNEICARVCVVARKAE
jgi:arsenite methyltransferase